MELLEIHAEAFRAREELAYEFLVMSAVVRIRVRFEYVNAASYKSRCVQMKKIFMQSIEINTNYAARTLSEPLRPWRPKRRHVNSHIGGKQNAGF